MCQTSDETGLYVINCPKMKSRTLAQIAANGRFERTLPIFCSVAKVRS